MPPLRGLVCAVIFFYRDAEEIRRNTQKYAETPKQRPQAKTPQANKPYGIREGLKSVKFLCKSSSVRNADRMNQRYECHIVFPRGEYTAKPNHRVWVPTFPLSSHPSTPTFRLIHIPILVIISACRNSTLNPVIRQSETITPRSSSMIDTPLHTKARSVTRLPFYWIAAQNR